MTLRLALRSLATQPVRSLVLAGGFGAGIAAMAGLLGVGEVVLEQARSPALEGGGELRVTGYSGKLTSTRYLMARVLGAPALASRSSAASPTVRTRLYLVEPDGETVAVGATGGIPSLERALGDPETSRVDAWRDSAEDRRWVDPPPGELLRAMDRFHAIPDVPARADSWAEWLYFNGRAEDGTRFYLTFLVGPRTGPDRRQAWVRLQLERPEESTSYAARAEIVESELLARAPDLQIGASHVALDGSSYRIHLELGREQPAGGSSQSVAAGPGHLVGELVLEAAEGRSLTPIAVHGAGGWVSGYVVPVFSGRLDGRFEIAATGPSGDRRREIVEIVDARGYHDHNWGFWEGVIWQWGQVAGEELSIVYGRIRPPADAADPARMPGFLMVSGPEGPLAHSSSVTIEELDGDDPASPRGFEVRAVGEEMRLGLSLEVVGTERTPYGAGGGRREMEFLQLRARYRVRGFLGEREIDFEATGSAETFRAK